MMRYLHYYGYVALVGAAIYLFMLWHDRKSARYAHQRLDMVFSTLAMMYVVGCGLKFGVIGPRIVRFHLSDFGFPLMVSEPLAAIAIRSYRRAMPRDPWEIEAPRVVILQQLAVGMGLVVSYLYEVLTGRLYAMSGERTATIVGKFDWHDILTYTIGAICGLIVLELRRRATKARAAEIVEQKRQAAEAQRTADRAERRHRRTTSRPLPRRRRRGGR